MLKDALNDLVAKSNPGCRPDCKLGRIIFEQDEKTQAILIQTLSEDSVSTIDLVRLLKSEGFPVSREFLGEKRNYCFKPETTPNNCCIADKLEAFKNENKQD